MEAKINEYPRFIQSTPCGEDKLESQSQKRLTDAIVKHIISTDKEGGNSNKEDDNFPKIPRIIGLEGGWGSGKSNVIKQIKNQVEADKTYYVFEYDAWGHQEDLQRRSFLETLTRELIDDNNNVLTDGDTDKKEAWQKKLDDMLARKVTRVSKTLPKFNAGALWTAIAIAITPFTIFIAERLESNYICENWILLTLIAFLPILIGLLIWGIFAIKNKETRNLGYLLKISKDENINTKNTETINEEEPNVFKFKKWMQDISEHLGDKNKKLIIVYDNMDRLPAEKVKELWSSIHTFFSEDDFDNVWAIIPFDEKHLSCAFGESEDKEKLTKYFISKTFPVVYYVTPPVMTDFKGIFNTLFKEAFGDTESKWQEDINRIFRLEKPDATVRDIIEFINQLVVLKNIWQSEIDIIYIAIFVLKKKDLLSDTKKDDIQPNEDGITDIKKDNVQYNDSVAGRILSGNYLGKYIPKIIPDDEELQKNISALVYGVSLDKAEQIPMSKYLDSCFNDTYINTLCNTDINRYIRSRVFMSVLSEKIKNIDNALLDNVILRLPQLDTDYLPKEDNDKVVELWNHIAIQKITTKLEKQEFDENYKRLLKHIDKRHQHFVIRYLCEEIQSFQEFSGKNYYIAMNDLTEFFSKNDFDINIEDYLSDLQHFAEVFVYYVRTAKENYPKYKMSTDSNKLVDYLCDSLDNGKYDEVLESLKYLNVDKNYDFSELLNAIETKIKSPLLDATNFKAVFDAYKILSKDKRLRIQLDSGKKLSIWNTYSSRKDSDEFLEILTMRIVDNNASNVNLNEEQIKYIAENIDYYDDYGNLLIKNLTWNNQILRQVLKYMTENSLGDNLSIDTILPRFVEIKSNIGVDEIVLLNRLNRWGNPTITPDTIESTLTNAQIFRFTKVATDNELADFLNRTIVEALSRASVDVLYRQKQQATNYWTVVIDTYIDTDYIKSLPDNLTELGLCILDDIASLNLKVPKNGDINHRIINKLDHRKTSVRIKEIRDNYCNAKYQYPINHEQFEYFEPWFEQQGELSKRTESAHRIIEPVIGNANCQKLIFAKADYYADIINKAGDDAIPLKDKIKQMLANNPNDSLRAFAKKINVEDV